MLNDIEPTSYELAGWYIERGRWAEAAPLMEVADSFDLEPGAAVQLTAELLPRGLWLEPTMGQEWMVVDADFVRAAYGDEGVCSW